MPLSAGDRLGPYEILAPLGAGGMVEVYRARDSRLGREVAIKVLSEQLTNDSQALARRVLWDFRDGNQEPSGQPSLDTAHASGLTTSIVILPLIKRSRQLTIDERLPNRLAKSNPTAILR